MQPDNLNCCIVLILLCFLLLSQLTLFSETALQVFWCSLYCHVFIFRLTYHVLVSADGSTCVIPFVFLHCHHATSLVLCVPSCVMMHRLLFMFEVAAWWTSFHVAGDVLTVCDNCAMFSVQCGIFTSLFLQQHHS